MRLKNKDCSVYFPFSSFSFLLLVGHHLCHAETEVKAEAVVEAVTEVVAQANDTMSSEENNDAKNDTMSSYVSLYVICFLFRPYVLRGYVFIPRFCVDLS